MTKNISDNTLLAYDQLILNGLRSNSWLKAK